MSPEYLIRIRAKDIKAANRARIALSVVEGIEGVHQLSLVKPSDNMPKSVDSVEWLRKPEAALYLGVSERTVQRWVASGALQAFREGKILRINKKTLFEFIEGRK